MKLFRTLIMSSLLAYPLYSNALGEIGLDLGYSSFDNSTTGIPTQTGVNLNVSYLIPVLDLPAATKLIVGPRLKYESVSGDIGGVTLSFSTLQLGAESGIKWTASPSVSVYGTVFGSYGLHSQMELKYAMISIKPDVKNSWQYGASTKGIYNLTPSFGLGLGLGYVGGYYEYSYTSIPTKFNEYNGYNIELSSVFSL